MCEIGRDIHTRVLRSEKGCRIRVTHVHTRSDCVHTRDDTVRLNYASRFVRVIYSSHVVSIKVGSVTRQQKKAGSKKKKRPEAQKNSRLLGVSLHCTAVLNCIRATHSHPFRATVYCGCQLGPTGVLIHPSRAVDQQCANPLAAALLLHCTELDTCVRVRSTLDAATNTPLRRIHVS